MSQALDFKIQHTLPGTLARTGVIKTSHGEIKTPCFVAAATKATVKTLTNNELTNIGVQAALANTYHLLLQPGVGIISKAGGLNRFMNYNNPTFTDSGGFQIFSLPDVKINDDGATFRSHLNGDKLQMTPESSMQAQWKIGADIHMAFDQLAKSNSKQDMRNAMEQTHRWLDRCIVEHERLVESHSPLRRAVGGSPIVVSGESELRRVFSDDTRDDGLAERHGMTIGEASWPARDGLTELEHQQALYGIVQGGTFLDLRQESAKYMADKNLDGFGIGGVFVADKLAEILTTVNNILPATKPKHLLGMGAEPLDLFIGVEHGIDTFDCVAPTRQARNGALYTHHGRINILNSKYKTDFSPIDKDCQCYCCKNHNKAYLHHLFKANEVLGLVLASIHNESFIVQTVDKIRNSIEDGDFDQFKSSFLASYHG